MKIEELIQYAKDKSIECNKQIKFKLSNATNSKTGKEVKGYVVDAYFNMFWIDTMSEGTFIMINQFKDAMGDDVEFELIE